MKNFNWIFRFLNFDKNQNIKADSVSYKGFKKRNEMQMTQMLSQIAKNQSFIIRAIPYYGKWGEIDSENDIKVFENQ